MAEVKLLKVDELPIGEIEVVSRLRPVSAAGVAAVMTSLNEIGHIVSPLWVRKTKTGYLLLDGAHRLEAARQHGLDVLPVRAFTCNDRQARFMEIDGNLAGAELTALDTAVFLAARKTVYEEEYPETKAAIAGGLARQGSAGDIMSFAAAAAEKMGVSERHVQRLTQVGLVLGPLEIEQLRCMVKSVALKDLMELAKMDNNSMRSDLVGRLAQGGVKSIAEGKRLYWSENKPAPKDPVEEAFKALLNAWKRAPKAAQRRFVAATASEIAPQINALNLEGDDV